ncbi:MAG: hypothetical protein HRT88_14575 [Lentisphaeraceae bacterium]|nr:hypothetical protein [Lentisphaeraceae bacterium]
MSGRFLVSSAILSDYINVKSVLAFLGKVWVQEDELIIRGLFGKVSKFTILDIDSYSFGVPNSQFSGKRFLILCVGDQIIGVSCCFNSSAEKLLESIQERAKALNKEIPLKELQKKVKVSKPYTTDATADQELYVDTGIEEVESHSDYGVSYKVDKIAKTCTCPDFFKVRAHLDLDDVGRFCKHLAEVLCEEHIPTHAVKAGYYKPPVFDEYAHYKSIFEFSEAIENDLLELGWHVELMDERLSIHEKFQNGKPKKKEFLALYYEEYSSYDSYVCDGEYRMGYRRKPWGVTGVKESTSNWKSLDEAVEVFMDLAENLAPVVKA